MTEESVSRELLAALEVAVLEEDSRRLLLAGAVPQWLGRFRPGVLSSPPRIERALGSSFLENFLEDADAFWTSKREGRLRSGMWTEPGPLGDDFHLEASAVSLDGRRFLLIEDLTPAYAERQSMLQKARTSRLAERERRREQEKREK